MATSSDDADIVRQAQDRILAALSASGDVTCSGCGAAIMPVFSVFNDWMRIAVYGQETVPAVQCPKAPGLHDIRYGPHQPKVAAATEIPFRTGDPR
ncbi:hypothetical protein ACQP2T_63670 (plasmid) [Nonomuraea sp. CA-143628]|uniref:hypothetical protein n=1 Tax=Nonomuraea sp. CA-143628 TaxID=3239997 RepID=UPI003D8D94D4